jgi:hypothetical protein
VHLLDPDPKGHKLLYVRGCGDTIGIIKKTKIQIEVNEDKEHEASSISFVLI